MRTQFALPLFAPLPACELQSPSLAWLAERLCMCACLLDLPASRWPSGTWSGMNACQARRCLDCCLASGDSLVVREVDRRNRFSDSIAEPRCRMASQGEERTQQGKKNPNCISERKSNRREILPSSCCFSSCFLWLFSFHLPMSLSLSLSLSPNLRFQVGRFVLLLMRRAACTSCASQTRLA